MGLTWIAFYNRLVAETEVTKVTEVFMCKKHLAFLFRATENYLKNLLTE